MKKLLCLCLTLALCLVTASAETPFVPTSTSALPDILNAPEVPSIVRVQKSAQAVTITLDRELSADASVTALGIDWSRSLVILPAAAGEGNTYTANGLPAGSWWTGFEIGWAEEDSRTVIRYNAAGGLDAASIFDHKGNEYLYDNDLRFCGFAYASNSVRVRFNTRGVMTRYGYKGAKNTTVWFDRQGNLLSADYYDGKMAATWSPDIGWYVNSPDGRVKVHLGIHPEYAKPLLSPEEEEQEPVKTINYPNNTICIAGLTLQEASATLPDKWYNILPVDLTKEGRQTYYLMISNMFYIGRCYVDVWGDEITVSCSLIDNVSIEPLSSYGRWFTSLSQITADSIESSDGGFIFGEPVSRSEDLGGADVALLFIRSKATYCQPFKDGTSLTRYWRNSATWKEFREGLQELMPLVEK